MSVDIDDDYISYICGGLGNLFAGDEIDKDGETICDRARTTLRELRAQLTRAEQEVAALRAELKRVCAFQWAETGEQLTARIAQLEGENATLREKLDKVAALESAVKAKEYSIVGFWVDLGDGIRRITSIGSDIKPTIVPLIVDPTDPSP